MKLLDILKDSFNADDSQISDNMKLADYGDWDSMTLMFFITKLEEGYGIDFTGDEIADNMETVGSIKKLIILKGKEL